jgi:hypothetical protein
VPPKTSHLFFMSAQEIIAQLPKLKPEELQLVKEQVEALVVKSPIPRPQTGLAPGYPLPRRQKENLAEFLSPVAGTAQGLPQDLAENHDHYLYGTPKRVQS